MKQGTHVVSHWSNITKKSVCCFSFISRNLRLDTQEKKTSQCITVNQMEGIEKCAMQDAENVYITKSVAFMFYQNLPILQYFLEMLWKHNSAVWFHLIWACQASHWFFRIQLFSKLLLCGRRQPKSSRVSMPIIWGTARLILHIVHVLQLTQSSSLNIPNWIKC